MPAYVKCVRMMGGLNDEEINQTYVKVESYIFIACLLASIFSISIPMLWSVLFSGHKSNAVFQAVWRP